MGITVAYKGDDVVKFNYLVWLKFLGFCFIVSDARANAVQEFDITSALAELDVDKSAVEKVAVIEFSNQAFWVDGLISNNLNRSAVSVQIKEMKDPNSSLIINFDKKNVSARTCLQAFQECKDISLQTSGKKLDLISPDLGHVRIVRYQNPCSNNDHCEMRIPSWALSSGIEKPSNLPRKLVLIDTKEKLLFVDAVTFKSVRNFAFADKKNLGKMQKVDSSSDGRLAVSFESGAILIDFIRDEYFLASNYGLSRIYSQLNELKLDHLTSVFDNDARSLVRVSADFIVWKSGYYSFIERKFTASGIDTVIDAGSSNGVIYMLTSDGREGPRPASLFKVDGEKKEQIAIFQYSENITNLSVIGGWVYLIRNENLNYLSKDGGEKKSLVGNVGLIHSVSGNDFVIKAAGGNYPFELVTRHNQDIASFHTTPISSKHNQTVVLSKSDMKTFLTSYRNGKVLLNSKNDD